MTQLGQSPFEVFLKPIVKVRHSQPPRLFQPPRLVIWQFLPLLHVYSNLHVY